MQIQNLATQLVKSQNECKQLTQTVQDYQNTLAQYKVELGTQQATIGQMTEKMSVQEQELRSLKNEIFVGQSFHKLNQETIKGKDNQILLLQSQVQELRQLVMKKSQEGSELNQESNEPGRQQTISWEELFAQSNLLKQQVVQTEYTKQVMMQSIQQLEADLQEKDSIIEDYKKQIEDQKVMFQIKIAELDEKEHEHINQMRKQREDQVAFAQKKTEELIAQMQLKHDEDIQLLEEKYQVQLGEIEESKHNATKQNLLLHSENDHLKEKIKQLLEEITHLNNEIRTLKSLIQNQHQMPRQDQLQSSFPSQSSESDTLMQNLQNSIYSLKHQSAVHVNQQKTISELNSKLYNMEKENVMMKTQVIPEFEMIASQKKLLEREMELAIQTNNSLRHGYMQLSQEMEKMKTQRRENEIVWEIINDQNQAYGERFSSLAKEEGGLETEKRIRQVFDEMQLRAKIIVRSELEKNKQDINQKQIAQYLSDMENERNSEKKNIKNLIQCLRKQIKDHTSEEKFNKIFNYLQEQLDLVRSSRHDIDNIKTDLFNHFKENVSQSNEVVQSYEASLSKSKEQVDFLKKKCSDLEQEINKYYDQSNKWMIDSEKNNKEIYELRKQLILQSTEFEKHQIELSKARTDSQLFQIKLGQAEAELSFIKENRDRVVEQWEQTRLVSQEFRQSRIDFSLKELYEKTKMENAELISNLAETTTKCSELDGQILILRENSLIMRDQFMKYRSQSKDDKMEIDGEEEGEEEVKKTDQEIQTVKEIDNQILEIIVEQQEQSRQCFKSANQIIEKIFQCFYVYSNIEPKSIDEANTLKEELLKVRSQITEQQTQLSEKQKLIDSLKQSVTHPAPAQTTFPVSTSQVSSSGPRVIINQAAQSPQQQSNQQQQQQVDRYLAEIKRQKEMIDKLTKEKQTGVSNAQMEAQTQRKRVAEMEKDIESNKNINVMQMKSLDSIIINYKKEIENMKASGNNPGEVAQPTGRIMNNLLGAMERARRIIIAQDAHITDIFEKLSQLQKT